MGKSTLILSAALAAAVASSVWLWGEWRDERAVSIDLRARVASLERQHEQAHVAAPVAIGAPLPAPRTASDIAESPSAARPVVSTPRYPDNRRQQLMKNPEFRKALHQRQRQEIEATYHDLPKALNLTPEQAARVFDLMADQGIRLLELQWGWPTTQQEGKSLQTMSEELRTQNDAELRQLLGDRNSSALTEFRSSLGSRSEVDSLRAELARSPEPLREDQVEPMIALVYVEEQRMNQELKDRTGPEGSLGPGYDATRVELAVAANQRIVESATAVLTEAQLSAVKDLYRRQRLQMEAQNELRRLQDEAALSGPATTKSN